MAILDEEAVKKLIKSDINENIFLFYGDDDYLKEFYCNKLIGITVSENLRAFNFHLYQDSDVPLDKIFADAEILPVMAEKSCLLIRNYPLAAMGSNETKEFEQNLSDVPDSAVIIFYYSASAVPEGKNAKWDNIIKIFSSSGAAVKIDHRTRSKTAKLLTGKAKEKGTSIDYETANYLIECVGEDMSNLLNEFNKAAAFASGEPITKEIIDITAVKSVEASVFDISTSIFAGDTDKAFRVLNELLRQKTPAQSIIGALASAYVNLYRYKVAINADKAVSDFAESFKYRETKYQFGKIAPIAKKTRLSSIKKAIDVLSEADIKSKSMKINDEILLSELIAKLSLALKD